MARLIIETDPAEPMVVELKEGLNSIGRLPGNDIRIDHPSISNKHCVISKKGGQFLIKDIESTNGIFVDEEPVREGPFNLGSRLRLGEVNVYFEQPDAMTEVYIKHTEKPAPVVQQFAEDGSPLCFLSPDLPADMQCSRCERYFSWGVINHLGISSGRQHHYCPQCHGECKPLAATSTPSTKEKVKKAFNSFMKALYKDGKSKK